MAETVKIIIDADDKASKTIGGVHGALDKLGGIAKAGAFAGVAVAGVALFKFVDILGESVQAAMEAQVVQAQLAAVIESTGGVAGVTADMVDKLASSYQKMIRFDDEALTGAASILLTFTNINKDIFPETLMLTADLATAWKTDLDSAAKMLGKALNDPIAGLAALGRVGIQFSEDQKAMIKALIEGGKAAEAQKIILAELQKQVGGSAIAAGDTFAGKLDILKQAFDDVKQSIGDALIPALSTLVTELGPKLIEWGESFAAWVQKDGAKAIQDLVDGFIEFIPKIEEAFGLIGDFITDDAEQFVELWKGVQKAIEDLQPVFELLTLFVSDLAAEWDALVVSIDNAIAAWDRWRGVQTADFGVVKPHTPGPIPLPYYLPLPAPPTTPPLHPPGGGASNPITVNVNIAGNADARTTRRAVLDALGLARAQGMV